MVALWVKIARLLHYPQMLKNTILIINKLYNYGKLDIERITLHFLVVMCLCYALQLFTVTFVTVLDVTIIDYLYTL